MIKKIFFSIEIVIFIFLILFILICPFFISKDPYITNALNSCLPPSIDNFFGTDEVGRDIFSRMMYGGRITIIIGIISSLFSCIIGTLMGVLSGYMKGKIDLFISQIINLSLAFPSLLLAIAISIILPQGIFSVILALTLTGWASFARIIRSQVLIIRNAEYILAAKTLGSSKWQIMYKHILPNCLNIIIVSFSLQLGSFMLAESGLSFLGLGILQPYPTLGGMISLGRDYLFTAPWIPIFPGFLIGFIVLLCNSAGDKLQSIIDPKRRSL